MLFGRSAQSKEGLCLVTMPIRILKRTALVGNSDVHNPGALLGDFAYQHQQLASQQQQLVESRKYQGGGRKGGGGGGEGRGGEGVGLRRDHGLIQGAAQAGHLRAPVVGAQHMLVGRKGEGGRGGWECLYSLRGL